MDVRASDGLTYGLGSDGTLYKITISITGTGSATAAEGKAVTALVLGEGGIAFDFNPASKLPADDMGNALRVIDGALNYRLNPVAATIAGTDTALTFKAGDAN
ncbi:MAG: DUF4394 domain-containing protein, partial [Polyangiaceae bacterium]|nr:DUF4394 domain-containing protein [Polyangiaceae bacterium]